MSQIETYAGVMSASNAESCWAGTVRSADQGDRLSHLAQISLLFSRGGFRGVAGLLGRGAGFAWHYRSHRHWMKIIGGTTTSPLLDIYPRIAYRHSTTHLFHGATWRQRLAFLCAHYTFLNDAFDRDTFARVIDQGGLPIWQDNAVENGPQIAIVGPCLESRHREGELGLQLSFDGTVLYKLAFSVVRTSDVLPGAGRRGLSLFVGQMQGGRDCRPLIRRAASLCLDNAPRDLLMSALEGVAVAWDMEFILGVAGTRSLSHGSCQFDHDTFWKQYGGVLCPGGHYVLPSAFREQPLRASSAAHRRRTRRKRLYKEELSKAVASRVQGIKRGSAPSSASAARCPDADTLQCRTWPQVDPTRQMSGAALALRQCLSIAAAGHSASSRPELIVPERR